MEQNAEYKGFLDKIKEFRNSDAWQQATYTQRKMFMNWARDWAVRKYQNQELTQTAIENMEDIKAEEEAEKIDKRRFRDSPVDYLLNKAKGMSAIADYALNNKATELVDKTVDNLSDFFGSTEVNKLSNAEWEERRKNGTLGELSGGGHGGLKSGSLITENKGGHLLAENNNLKNLIDNSQEKSSQFNSDGSNFNDNPNNDKSLGDTLKNGLKSGLNFGIRTLSDLEKGFATHTVGDIGRLLALGAQATGYKEGAGWILDKINHAEENYKHFFTVGDSEWNPDISEDAKFWDKIKPADAFHLFDSAMSTSADVFALIYSLPMVWSQKLLGAGIKGVNALGQTVDKTTKAGKAIDGLSKLIMGTNNQAVKGLGNLWTSYKAGSIMKPTINLAKELFTSPKMMSDLARAGASNYVSAMPTALGMSLAELYGEQIEYDAYGNIQLPDKTLPAFLIAPIHGWIEHLGIDPRMAVSNPVRRTWRNFWKTAIDEIKSDFADGALKGLKRVGIKVGSYLLKNEGAEEVYQDSLSKINKSLSFDTEHFYNTKSGEWEEVKDSDGQPVRNTVFRALLNGVSSLMNENNAAEMYQTYVLSSLSEVFLHAKDIAGIKSRKTADAQLARLRDERDRIIDMGNQMGILETEDDRTSFIQAIADGIEGNNVKIESSKTSMIEKQLMANENLDLNRQAQLTRQKSIVEENIRNLSEHLENILNNDYTGSIADAVTPTVADAMAEGYRNDYAERLSERSNEEESNNDRYIEEYENLSEEEKQEYPDINAYVELRRMEDSQEDSQEESEPSETDEQKPSNASRLEGKYSYADSNKMNLAKEIAEKVDATEAEMEYVESEIAELEKEGVSLTDEDLNNLYKEKALLELNGYTGRQALEKAIKDVASSSKTNRFRQNKRERVNKKLAEKRAEKQKVYDDIKTEFQRELGFEDSRNINKLSERASEYAENIKKEKQQAEAYERKLKQMAMQNQNVDSETEKTISQIRAEYESLKKQIAEDEKEANDFGKKARDYVDSLRTQRRISEQERLRKQKEYEENEKYEKDFARLKKQDRNRRKADRLAKRVKHNKTNTVSRNDSSDLRKAQAIAESLGLRHIAEPSTFGSMTYDNISEKDLNDNYYRENYDTYNADFRNRESSPVMRDNGIGGIIEGDMSPRESVAEKESEHSESEHSESDNEMTGGKLAVGLNDRTVSKATVVDNDGGEYSVTYDPKYGVRLEPNFGYSTNNGMINGNNVEFRRLYDFQEDINSGKYSIKDVEYSNAEKEKPSEKFLNYEYLDDKAYEGVKKEYPEKDHLLYEESGQHVLSELNYEIYEKFGETLESLVDEKSDKLPEVSKSIKKYIDERTKEIKEKEKVTERIKALREKVKLDENGNFKDEDEAYDAANELGRLNDEYDLGYDESSHYSDENVYETAYNLVLQNDYAKADQIAMRYIAKDIKKNIDNIINQNETHEQRVARIKDTLKGKKNKQEATKAEQPKTEAKSNNRLFSEDEAKKRFARLKSAARRIGVNPFADPQIVEDVLFCSGYLIENGVRKFSDYCKQMIDNLGDSAVKFKDHFAGFYMMAKKSPEVKQLGINKSEFSTEDEVDEFDVDSLFNQNNESADNKETSEESKTNEYISSISEKYIPQLLEGKKDNRWLANIAKELGLLDDKGEYETKSKKVQELFEGALVRYVHNNIDKITFEDVMKLYENQPSLNTRTAKSINNQAYSTPLPLAYLMCRAIGNVKDGSTVLEPTAGNGMFISFINPDADFVLNEFDTRRESILRANYPDAKITTKDATDYDLVENGKADLLVSNPPFGDSNRTETIGNVSVKKIDHRIILKNLQKLKDNGKAILIFGAPYSAMKNEYNQTGSYIPMMSGLYNNYNVVSHFRVDGSLYKKQGAEWPVECVIIDGKSKKVTLEDGFKTPKAIKEESVDVCTSFEQVYDILGKIEGSKLSEGRSGNGEENTGDVNGYREGNARPNMVKDGQSSGRENERKSSDNSGDSNAGTGLSDKSGGQRGRSVSDSNRERRPESSDRRRNSENEDTSGRSGDNGLHQGIGNSSRSSVSQEHVNDYSEVVGAEPTEKTSDDMVEKPVNTKVKEENVGNTEDVSNNKLQARYIPRGKVNFNINSLTSVNLVKPTQQALSDLQNNYLKGKPLEQYVSEKCGINADKALSGEQVDAVALGCKALETGSGMVIADQTGLGKGRTCSALISAIKNMGKIPVYMTNKDGLFTDIFRDMDNIGKRNLRPFILNAEGVMYDKDENSTVDENGDIIKKVVYKHPDGKIKNPITGKKESEYETVLQHIIDGDFSDFTGPDAKFDYICSTYSQFSKREINVSPSKNASFFKRINAIKSLGDNMCMVLDEVHDAASEDINEDDKDKPANEQKVSAKFENFANFSKLAHSVIYVSATWAKRPGVLPLYFRAFPNNATYEDVKNAVESNTAGMLEMVISNMAANGKYLRREQSFEGVEYKNVIADESEKNKKYEEKLSDGFNSCLRSIVSVSSLWNSISNADSDDNMMVSPFIPDTWEGSKSNDSSRTARYASSISSPFSQVQNFLNTFLLGVKADLVANEAIKKVENGSKVVISVEATRETDLNKFMANNEVGVGGNIKATMTDSALGMLNGVFRLSVKNGSNKLDKRRITYFVNGDVLVEDTSETGAVKEKPKFFDHKETGFSLPSTILDAYNEARKNIMSKADILNKLPMSPIDYIRYKLSEAGIKNDEITGRGIYAEYNSDGTQTIKTRSDKEKKLKKISNASNFNNNDIDVLIINKSGANGISLHSAKEFKKHNKREMIFAQPFGDINDMMQMIGRIFRVGQVNYPEYTYLMTNLELERKIANMLQNKLKVLNASTTSNQEGSQNFSDIDVLNKYGTEVITSFLRDTTEGMELARSMGYVRRDEHGIEQFTGIADAKQAIGRAGMLDQAEQRMFWQQVIERYNNKIEELNSKGENDLIVQKFDDADAVRIGNKVLLNEEQASKDKGNASYFEYVDLKIDGNPSTLDMAESMLKDGFNDLESKEDKLLKDIETFSEFKVKDLLKRARERGDNDYNPPSASEYASTLKVALRSALKKLKLGNVLENRPVDSDGRSIGNEMGMVVDVKVANSNPEKGDNPFVGKIKVTLAYPGKNNKIIVPYSRLAKWEVAYNENGDGYYSKTSMEHEWNKHVEENKTQRQRATIITNNIINGIDYQRDGKIVELQFRDNKATEYVLMTNNLVDNSRFISDIGSVMDDNGEFSISNSGENMNGSISSSEYTPLRLYIETDPDTALNKKLAESYRNKIKKLLSKEITNELYDLGIELTKSRRSGNTYYSASIYDKVDRNRINKILAVLAKAGLKFENNSNSNENNSVKNKYLAKAGVDIDKEKSLGLKSFKFSVAPSKVNYPVSKGYIDSFVKSKGRNITNNTGVTFTVHETEKDLEKAIGEKVPANAEGCVSGNTIHIVRQNLSANRLNSFIAHELAGHIGVESLFNTKKEMDNFFNALSRASKSETMIKKAFDEVKRLGYQKNIPHEAMAKIVEMVKNEQGTLKGAVKSFVSSLVVKVKNFLRKFGIAKGVSDYDVYDIAVRALRKVENEQLEPLKTEGPLFSDYSDDVDGYMNFLYDHNDFQMQMNTSDEIAEGLLSSNSEIRKMAQEKYDSIGDSLNRSLIDNIVKQKKGQSEQVDTSKPMSKEQLKKHKEFMQSEMARKYIEERARKKAESENQKKESSEKSLKEKFNDLVERGEKMFRLNWANNRDRLEQLENDIAKRRKQSDISDSESANKAFDTMDGRIEEKISDMNKKYVDKLLSKLAESKISYDDFNMFVYAKHMREREKYIQEKDKAGSEFYSGTGWDFAKWGTPEKVLKELSDKYGTKTLMDAGKIFWDMNREKVEMMRNYEIISDKAANDILGRYEFYTPLKSIKGDETSTVANKRAMGRFSTATDHLMFAIADIDSIVRMGERNIAKQAFFRLATANPDSSLYDVGRMNIIKKFDKEGNIRYEYDKHFNDQNTVVVTFNGKDGELIHRYITINDADLRKAFIGQKRVGTIVSTLLKMSRMYNNLKGFVSTIANPEFGVPNFFRDQMQAGAENYMYRGADFAKNVFKMALPAIRTYVQYNKGIENSETKLMKEFFEEGGKTGYADILRLDERAKNLKQMLDDEIEYGKSFKGKLVKAYHNPANAVRAMFGVFETFNDALEVATRFSVYKEARKTKTARQSAALAKNITINFNRHGAYTTSEANAIWLFFNASIQGTTKSYNLYKEGMKTPQGRMAIGAVVAAGFLAELLASVLSGDDPDEEKKYYDLLDESKKDTNFVFMMPDSKNYVSVPLSPVIATPYMIGRNLATVVRGKKGVFTATSDIANNAMNSVIPFSEDNRGFVARTVPTLAKPAYDLYYANSDWTGKTIVPENNPFGIQKPKHERYYGNTSRAYIELARFLSELTGGDKYNEGKLEVSPEEIKYIVREIGGGIGHLGERTVNLIAGNAKTPNDIPVTRRFYNSIDDRESQREYSENLNAMKTFDDTKNHDTAYLKSHKDLYRKAAILKNSQKRIKLINSSLYGEDYKRSEILKIKKRANAAIRKLNK